MTIGRDEFAEKYSRNSLRPAHTGRLLDDERELAMYERFTDRARKVMQLANREALEFHLEYIGTEHILLGLVKEGSGVAANVLKMLDVDLRMVRLEVGKIVQPGPEMVTMGTLPHSPRAQNVIEYSMEEARNLGHNYVGTEHILLGLLREQDSVAAQVLRNLGLNLDEVREEVLNLLGHGSMTAPSPLRTLNTGVQEVLRLAKKEAESLNHGIVTTGHLLLAAIQPSAGVTSVVLQHLGLELEPARKELQRLILESPPWPKHQEPLLSSAFSEAGERAVAEVRAQNAVQSLEDQSVQLTEKLHDVVASQQIERALQIRDEVRQLRERLNARTRMESAHLLLAMLREPPSIARRMIENLGLHPEPLCDELVRAMKQQNS